MNTYIVPLPNPRIGLEEKMDITDFFVKLGKTKTDFQLLLDISQVYIPPEKEEDEPRITDYLCELAIGAGVIVFLDQSDNAFLSLPEDPIVAYPIPSGKFRGWLSAKYWSVESKGFSSNIFKEVVDLLTAKAYFENHRIQLWNRLAMIENTIYYDLGDGRRVVKIDKNGWEISSKSPVKFRRFYHQLQQVDPDKNGNIFEVIKFVNLKNDRDKLLFLTYLITAFNPIIAKALFTLFGDQGSAKSTTFRVVRCIIDPSNAGTHHPSKAGNLLSPPKDEADLAGKSVSHHCLFFDNMSYCPEWLSDAFARMVTGASFSKRKLYTDVDEIIINEMPLLAMNGINLVAEKPDLLDRLLIIETERIAETDRKPEREFWSEFREALPSILGGLFSVLSKTLAVVETIDLGTLPRMADYATTAASASVALGKSKDDFLLAFNQNVQKQNEFAISASPVAQVLLQFMNTKTEWSGSSTELYKELFDIAEKSNLKIGGAGGFPKAPNWLWKKIKQIKTNLSSHGINIIHDESSISSLIEITKVLNSEDVDKAIECLLEDKSVDKGHSEPDVAIQATVAANPEPSDKCRACGGTNFWKRLDGVEVCSTCHPQVN